MRRFKMACEIIVTYKETDFNFTAEGREFESDQFMAVLTESALNGLGKLPINSAYGKGRVAIRVHALGSKSIHEEKGNQVHIWRS